MTSYLLHGAFDLGCIFAILSLGVFISFKILNIPDMTVDGSFTLGAAICAALTLHQQPLLALLAAFLISSLAGIVTALLYTKLKIQPILAGILTMTGLYSINLRILGNSPSISLFQAQTLFSSLSLRQQSGFLFILLILIAFLLYLFLNTHLGLSLRACGDNKEMVKASSINTDAIQILGLALANGLVGLAGALLTQYQLFADSTSGTGTLVIALASIILGESCIKTVRLSTQFISVCLGAILYRFILTFALQLGVHPTDLKLMSALLVMIAISLPSLKQMLYQRQKRRNHHA